MDTEGTKDLAIPHADLSNPKLRKEDSKNALQHFKRSVLWIWKKKSF
jgi:hypothetical protein